MVIKLIKKTDVEGVYYYTTVNEKIVIGSTKYDIKEAEKVFRIVVENKGDFSAIEVINIVTLK